MLLTLFYGLIKGGREIVKKKAIEKSTVFEVLFFYTLFAFLFLIPGALMFPEDNIRGLSYVQLGFIAIKSFVIFIAWICSFKAIEKIPISVYGLLDLSRVIFATLLAVLVLGESVGKTQILGLILVALGLLFLKFGSGKEPEKSGAFYVVLALLSCVLNAVSGMMDKILTNETLDIGMKPGQLQFWYMLFLTMFYGMYFFFSKTELDIRKNLKNWWIWILSLLFVLADRALFMANQDPASKVTVMTLIKQSGCLVTILGGRLVFKEKNIVKKLVCAAIIITGIFIGVL
ncbi:MAG: DMT family transporter [Lachnospiraceae bacterium]|nr:DMT family transporter [Lachnospiraceae bacterium]